MADSPLVLVALFAAGTVAGTVNVLAGGGSLLTLPVLIFAGLPAVTANGTNRVAILMQNIVATGCFQRSRVVPWSIVLWTAIPATVGSVLGARLALLLSDQQFQRILAWIMVAVTLWTVARGRARRRSRRAGEASDPPKPGELEPLQRPPRPWTLAAGFVVVGAYGGFVQAGVGFLILAALGLAGLDFVRGNAIKVFAVLCFTVVSLTIFALDSQVDWSLGLALGVGNSLGALLGVRLTVLKGHVWLERVVMVTVLIFAVALWVRS